MLMAVTSATARGIKYSCLSLTSCRAGVSRLLSLSRTNTDIHTLALQFISIRFRWLLWLSKKKKKKKAKKSNHTVLFHSGDMEDQRRTLLSFLCFPHILLSAHLKHTPFTSLIFCLLICFASKLSAVPAVSRISASSSLSPHINSLH